MTTNQVAQMIGLSSSCLFEMRRNENLQFPARAEGDSHHRWAEEDINRLKRFLSDRARRKRQRREEIRRAREQRFAKIDREYESFAGTGEARAMLALINFNGMPVAYVRSIIDVSPAEEMELRRLRGDESGDLAVAYRKMVLAAFDRLVAKYNGRLPKVVRPTYRTREAPPFI